MRENSKTLAGIAKKAWSGHRPLCDGTTLEFTYYKNKPLLRSQLQRRVCCGRHRLPPSSLPHRSMSTYLLVRAIQRRSTLLRPRPTQHAPLTFYKNQYMPAMHNKVDQLLWRCFKRQSTGRYRANTLTIPSPPPLTTHLPS